MVSGPDEWQSHALQTQYYMSWHNGTHRKGYQHLLHLWTLDPSDCGGSIRHYQKNCQNRTLLQSSDGGSSIPEQPIPQQPTTHRCRRTPSRIEDARRNSAAQWRSCTRRHREPVYRVIFRSERALRTPMTEMGVGRAYLAGDIEVDGDFGALFNARQDLQEKVPLRQKLQFVYDFIRTATKMNGEAIGDHYGT
ncbi:hypothetical protein PENFLA_c035G05148 [Penicillium flavigenum]|uniref:Uncharacterized protein n=1 Tax=Penicillium flavigenum TaxID=254877 RepID=A0A1V6SL44_9EURO|nr:hypothetical protein PENFLA_c035G05148 [Penicillium flavigenum]